MRKVGKLNNIPLVQGNINELKDNQILVSNEGGKIKLSKRNNGTVDSITSGSDSSGEDKIYYYKCDINKDNCLTEKAIVLIILSQSVIESYIINDGLYCNDLWCFNNSETYPSSPFYFLACGEDISIKGFSVYEKEQTKVILDRSETQSVTFIKGSFFEKTEDIAKTLAPSEEDFNIVMEMLRTYVTEISKEEYMSMIKS